jgi:hypothetical protein
MQRKSETEKSVAEDITRKVNGVKLKNQVAMRR